MATQKQTPVYEDKTYKLTSNAAPLSFILASRHSARFPLLHFDPQSNTNRALRYARNQKSPFEDEQDGNAILEPVIFTDGFLKVSKTNPVLQQFLDYHPQKGRIFVEVDKAKDAQQEVDVLMLEAEALQEAKNLPIDQLEMAARIVLGKDVTKMSTAEMRRDMLVSARRDPRRFLAIMRDPSIMHQSKVRSFFDQKMIILKSNRREVWLNLPESKRRLCVVPFGEDPFMVAEAWLHSEEGLEVYKSLESEFDLGS